MATAETLDRNGYHTDYSSVSRTMLNLFATSRLEYYLTYITRELPTWTPTKPALIGTVLHAAILEGKPLDDLVRTYPPDMLKSNGALKNGAAQEAELLWPGAVVLKEDEIQPIRDAYEAVIEHPQISAVIEAAQGQTEQRFDAPVEGVPCRALLDIACDMGDHYGIYDLKFVGDIHPGHWARSSKRLRYWLQDAHYCAVVSAATGKPCIFRFIAVETKFPFRVQLRWFEPRSREIGRDAHAKLLRQLTECHETNQWADDWSGETVLNPWDVEDANEDLVEVEQ